MTKLFEKESPIIAFDVSNITYRAANRGQRFTNSKGYPSGHIYIGFNILQSNIRKIAEDQKPQLLFALDGKPTRRLRLDPDYKGTRDSGVKPLPGLTKDQVVADFVEMVSLFPGKVVRHKHLEADDILAALTHKQFRGRSNVTLVSKDHDLWQLLGFKNVRVWYKDHFVDHTHVIAKYGLNLPRSVALYKSIFGDVGDNVKNSVPHMNKNPVVKLINQHGIVKPQELFEVLEDSSLTASAKEKLLEAHSQIELNWKLVKLKRKTKKKLKFKPGPDSPTQLIKLLKRYECKSLYDKAEKLWK